MTGTPSDPGLQPERTLLSWRRTCLALGLASVVAVRFTGEELGATGIALGVVGIVLSVGAHLAATRRYRRVLEELRTGGGISTDAVPLALVTATLVVLGLACAVYVLSHGCSVWL